MQEAKFLWQDGAVMTKNAQCLQDLALLQGRNLVQISGLDGGISRDSLA